MLRQGITFRNCDARMPLVETGHLPLIKCVNAFLSRNGLLDFGKEWAWKSIAFCPLGFEKVFQATLACVITSSLLFP